MPTIIIAHSGTSTLAGQSQRFPLERLRIGRRPDNDVHFDPVRDQAVSGYHAEVWVDGAGLRFKDLGSQNGSFINGAKVGGEQALGAGDVVRLGQNGPELRFTLEAAAASGAAPASGAPGKVTVGLNTLENAINRATLHERRKSRVVLTVAIGAVVLLGAGAAIYGVKTQQAEKARIEAEQAKMAAEVGSTKAVAEQAAQTATAALGKVETSVKEGMARYEHELTSLQGKLSDGEGKVARLIVELQTRDQALEVIRQRQDLSEGERKKLMAETEERIVGLKEQLNQNEEKLRAEEQRVGPIDWAAIVEQHKESVFLCLTQTKADDKGSYRQGTGTAFAIREDGLLATNSHVAEMFSDMSNLQAAVVIQNETGKIFPVKRVKKHPAWKGSPEGPDVALIEIDTKGETLVPFKLADEDRLRTLRIGTQLGTMGYPGELTDAYLSAVDNKKGVVLSALATFKDGWIGRITDYERKRAEYEDSKFIQHSASLSGGTSGSPMFDRDGYVVALNNSGLDMFVRVQAANGEAEGVTRTPSAAQIGNAIRVDELTWLVGKSGW